MGKRNIVRKLAGISAVEAAKEEALRQHLRGLLAGQPGAHVSVPKPEEPPRPAEMQPKPAKTKRNSRQNRDLERALNGGNRPESLPQEAPHVRGFNLYTLGYSKAHIARTLGVSWDAVYDWEKAHDWEARREAILQEADRHRAAQISTIRDLAHVTSTKILAHVEESLGDLGAPDGPRPDAEDLRDLATAAEKAVKTVIPDTKGVQVGVQVNLGDALAESRKYEIVEAQP